MLKESYDVLRRSCNEADHCCPDLFDMYIFNDFHGYGLIEILENIVSKSVTEMHQSAS